MQNRKLIAATAAVGTVAVGTLSLATTGTAATGSATHQTDNVVSGASSTR